MSYPNGSVIFLAHRNKWVGYCHGRIVVTKATESAVKAWFVTHPYEAVPRAASSPTKEVKVTSLVDDTIKGAIVQKVKTLVDKINTLHPNLGFKLPSVSFYDRGRAAGWARLTDHSLRFNAILAAENPSTFEDTVIHEVGHLYAYAMYGRRAWNHGPLFKSACWDLGGTGNRTHSYDVSSVSTNRKTAKVACSCKVHQVTPRKAANIAANPGHYKCKMCKSTVKVV